MLQAGPAAKAGIKPGDVLLRVAGKDIHNVGELLSHIAALPPGQSVRVELSRRNAPMSLDVTPTQRPKLKTAPK